MMLNRIVLSLALITFCFLTNAQEIKKNAGEIRKIEIKANSRDLKTNVRDNNHASKIIARKRAMLHYQKALKNQNMKKQAIERNKMRKEQLQKHRQLIQQRRLAR